MSFSDACLRKPRQSQYTICDTTLLIQIYFYQWKRRRVSCDERRPLLPGNDRETVSATVLLVRYTGALLFVVAVGIAAWWIGEIQQIDPTPPPTSRLEIHILGWTSAILYVRNFAFLNCSNQLTLLQLVARIPQICTCPCVPIFRAFADTPIVKNPKTQCEGLSPALFFFSMFGNVTYTLSICSKSMDREYLITNASWLAGWTSYHVCCMFILRVTPGSALTVFLDAIVSIGLALNGMFLICVYHLGSLSNFLLPISRQGRTICQWSLG